MTTNSQCPFCHLPPERILLSNDVGWVIRDTFPVSPGHTLVIPKRHIASMAQITPQDSALMGKIMTLAPQLALDNGCEPYPQGGYRIVINTGTHGGQEVHHLHVHIIGGPRPWKQG